ncbi:MAG: hypothetical protein KatS3mg104_0404 [Phycisphaerae bacterium]|nr:MAG: hypothetical protein KatS3mg104_0404 [Phycisphaerae bacterium]
MLTLDSGNVLLKPAHKKQLLARLKRITRLGKRLGQFFLKITFHRSGKHVQITAQGYDRFGPFTLKSKATDWNHAFHLLIHEISCLIHQHSVHRQTLSS